VNLVRVRPGKQSLDWLGARIADLKGDDPLAPVTVVVSSNHVGLAARRNLARGGYANVRFGVMGRLVEPLGAPALAAAGRSPLTLPSREAAIREAIRRKGQDFKEVGEHPALVRVLGELFGELREAETDEARLQQLAGRGLMAELALGVYREYLAIVSAAGLYDDQDLLASATAALSGTDISRQVREIGAVVVYLPAAQKPAETRFLKALSMHCSVDLALSALAEPLADTPSASIAEAFGASWSELAAAGAGASAVSLIAAPDATEEVRSVVRLVLSKLEEGLELRRIAIVYRDREPYGPLIRDTLDAAEVPWAGIDGRPLAESWAGRSMIGLLRLRERRFARVAVLAWLGALPVADPGGVSIGDWDRLSREAGVVSGAKQWVARLRLQAEGINAQADEMERTGASEGAIRYRRREAGALKRMANFIEGAERNTQAPIDAGWSALADWAEKARRTYAPVRDDWPEREREADEMIGELLIQMASAGAVEDKVNFERFVEVCEAALESRHQAEGRLGSGVAVGPVGALYGMEFELVFVLGATERALPRAAAPDPVFPPDGGPDPLGRTERRRAEERRDFLAAIAAAKSAWLTFPAFDPDLRPSYPSPWVIAFAETESGRPVSAADLREGKGAKNVLAIPSPDAGLEKAPSLLNVAEWRVVVARRERGVGGLKASGLALRADLPLRRQLEVRAARLSSLFTEFDGNVASEVAGLEVLSAGLDRRGHSPSSIEGWATCPFSYLLSRVLRIEETERPEQEIEWAIGALTRGALVHDVLSRFFGELHAHGRPGPAEAYTAADQKLIEDIAKEEFARLEAAGATGNALAWENEKQALLVDLQTFLRRDEKVREDGLVPSLFEQGFGMGRDPWDELSIDLPDGRRARLRGRIDRIDLGPDPSAPQVARLIDYKTGGSTRYSENAFRKDPVVAGTKVQPSIYGAAIRARYPGIRVESAYWFASSKGAFKLMSVPDDPERLRSALAVVDRGIRAGAFPQVPGSESGRPGAAGWDNCSYCPYDRVCPNGRDQMQERKQDQPGPRIHLELGGDDGS
jgi:ATP-dependent helicase/nuclease subunit B